MVISDSEKRKVDVLRHKVHMMGELLTLRQIVDRMVVYGDRVCMMEKRKGEVVSFTANRFRSDVAALATALNDMGLKGKHIAIISENSYNWVVCFFAISCGGSVVVPIDKELKDETISGLLTKADVDAVCFSRPYLKTAQAHMAADSRCAAGIAMTKKADGENMFFIDDLIEKGNALIAKGDTSYADTVIGKDDLAAIVFTSGTTGANKGVMLTHGNFAQNADGVLETIDPSQYSSISLLPMNHVYELSCNILTSLYMNNVVFINDSLKNFMNNVQEFAPDAFAIVPLVVDTIYTTIWRTAEQTGRADVLRKGIKISNFMLEKFGVDLRPKLFSQIAEKFGGKFPTLSCGGAPTRTEYVKCLCDIGFTIYNGYGLTESSPTVTLNLDCRNYPDCAGYAFPKAKFRINEPEADGVGEIWIKGDNVTSGYYKEDEANRVSFEDGWFKTGDYGRTDEKGRLYIVGRKKNLIILDNGKNVFPEEVESVFMEHIPYIHAVVIFEAEKEINGRMQKIIAAGFEVHPDELEKDLLDNLEQRLSADVEAVNRILPSYKKVQDTFISLEEFPINTQRKVVRKYVVEAYYNQLKK